MKTHRRQQVLIAGLAAMLWAGTHAVPSSAIALDREIRVTLSGPVELPGKILPAGSYVFEVVEPGKVTRVLGADGKTTYGMFLTVPETRKNISDASVVLQKAPDGIQRIDSWFVQGSSEGSQFVYPVDSNRLDPAISGFILKDGARIGEDAARGVAVSAEQVGKEARRLAGAPILHATVHRHA